MEEPEEEVDVAAMFDLTQKKKKKKKTKVVATDSNAENNESNLETSKVPAGDEESPPSYSYDLLLGRVFDFLHQNNSSLIEKTRYTMKPPQVQKTIILSFQRNKIITGLSNLQLLFV